MAKALDGVSDGTKLPLVEEFFTIQGEGFNAGKAAWLIRLGGCDIGCNWCDSRFSWNAEMFPLIETETIAGHAIQSGAKSVVVTGGEPLMWNLETLCSMLRERKISTFIETSGAYALSGKWDWICLSPKKNMPPSDNIFKQADELKVIIETQDDFKQAERYKKMVGPECKLFLQPEWSRFKVIIPEIVSYVKKNPVWRISLQIHKYMHIP
ncbi:MAG: 7-carboxy-7-deazaguanine synthase QueE [Bacteroidota bacterium]|nr:7-carboxy-7-deazaguanine synthase QueE [Bacteroidota bacterium]